MNRLDLSVCCLSLLVILIPQVLCQESTETSDDTTAEPDMRHLTVTSILTEPWLQLNEEGAKGNDRFTGFIADMVKEVAERSKFSYTITQAIDGKYGSKVEETHSWNGMIGEVVNNDAQMAAAPLTITHARSHVVAFTEPWMNVSLSALVPADSGINTLKDLVDQTAIPYGTIQGGSTMEAFRFTQEDIYLDMWAHIGGDDATNMKTIEEGIMNVKRGNYSFILERPMAEYYANAMCSVSMIEESFLPIAGYGFALQKDDRLIDDVNKALESMRKDETIDELYRQWFIDIECSASALTASLLLSFLVVITPLL